MQLGILMQSVEHNNDATGEVGSDPRGDALTGCVMRFRIPHRGENLFLVDILFLLLGRARAQLSAHVNQFHNDTSTR